MWVPTPLMKNLVISGGLQRNVPRIITHVHSYCIAHETFYLAMFPLPLPFGVLKLPTVCGRRGRLLVSSLVSRSSGPGSNPGQGRCVAFLDKTLYYRSASLHPGVKRGTGEFNAGGNPVMD